MDKIVDVKDFGTIRSIDLQVGPACNMRCRHCQQMPEKGVSVCVQEPSEDVMKVLDSFIRFSRNPEIIKEGNAVEPACRIMFYGGEALLYWDICKGVVTHFMEKYDLLSDYGFRFAVTTNGTLIDEEFVEFVNKYDILVMFSYDAPYPFAVRDYVSDGVCALVNKIRHAKILAAGNAYNCDLLTMYRCLEAKFPNAVYKPSLEVNRTFAGMPDDVDAYDFGKVRIGIRKLVIGAKMEDGFCLHALRNFLLAKISPQSNFFHNTKMGICVATRRILAMTMTGDISFCYNTYDRLGNIRDDTLGTVFRKAKAVWESIYDPACDTCEARDMCYWGCARLLRDGNGHAYNCERFRKPFFRILREEVMALNGPLTEGEKEWFATQEEIMRGQVKEFLLEGERKGSVSVG